MSYELLGSIFMALMFGHLVWNIQKRLSKPPRKDYSNFMKRLYDGEELNGCNMFNKEHYYYNWHTCQNCGHRMYGEKFYTDRGLV